MSQLNWSERSKNFFTVPGGRFDLFRSADPADAGLVWVAVDWDYGTSFRGTRSEAERWAEAEKKSRPDLLAKKPGVA